MRTLLAFAIWFWLIGIASAGTLTFTITTAGGTVTKTYTDTDANINLIGTAIAARCQNQQGSACNNAQLATLYFNQLVAFTINLVTQYQQNAAASTVSPINPQ